MGPIDCCHGCPKKEVGCKPTCVTYNFKKALYEVEKGAGWMIRCFAELLSTGNMQERGNKHG